MGKTRMTIDGEAFRINGELTYSGIPGSNPRAHGLLMNARFIQGIFDDQAEPSRFARFGRSEWDPEENTNRLIEALPEWYAHGLRAFTVGFQGGGPCFTTDNNTIVNNPFGHDGLSLDTFYAERMDRLIRAADELGMCVIVSYLYGSQSRHLADGRAVRNAVATASRFLRDGGYTNVIIEVANEQDVDVFKQHPIMYEPEGTVALMDLAREASGHLPVGCSSVGGVVHREIAAASDVALIHGNGQSRQRFHNLIQQTRAYAPHRPVVCNEDSQCHGQLTVAIREGVSWGYYNNMTKQEPPADWSITPGEDRFFAVRMARAIGTDLPEPPPEEQFYLQGMEPHMTADGKRWVRLASLYPERIDFVEFLVDGERIDTAYDEPFMLFYRNTWIQAPWTPQPGEKQMTARIHLRDGEVIERTAEIP